MIASGACVTCEMVTSKFIEQSEWPYWHLLAVSASLGTLPVAMLLYFRPTNWPSLADTKWVLARSAFEDLHWYLAVVAVIIGAPPGDVAALTSIDIIAAAFFGLIFLGEKLRKIHLVALVLAIGGAICIARPGFIFGFSQSSCRYCTVGYCLALLSGCFQAASFVCARKSAHICWGIDIDKSSACSSYGPGATISATGSQRPRGTNAGRARQSSRALSDHYHVDAIFHCTSCCWSHKMPSSCQCHCVHFFCHGLWLHCTNRIFWRDAENFDCRWCWFYAT